MHYLLEARGVHDTYNYQNPYRYGVASFACAGLFGYRVRRGTTFNVIWLNDLPAPVETTRGDCGNLCCGKYVVGSLEFGHFAELTGARSDSRAGYPRDENVYHYLITRNTKRRTPEPRV